MEEAQATAIATVMANELAIHLAQPEMVFLPATALADVWSATVGSINAVGAGVDGLPSLVMVPGRCPGRDHTRRILSCTLRVCCGQLGDAVCIQE